MSLIFDGVSMKRGERQKMCTSCDGRIPLDANLCPYCAAEQGSASLHHKSIQESLSSLYPPPYAAKNAHFVKEQQQMHSSLQEPIVEKMVEKMAEKRFTSATASPHIHLDSAEQQSTEEKSSFWPLLFLSIAANLLVLGLLQLFFSDNGLLTLQWDSHYWFIYCLAALPLFYVGLKKANSG